MYDKDLIENMVKVRDICSSGLKIRDENRLKLRQPLSKAYTAIKDENFKEIIKSELNVKEIEESDKPAEGDHLITEGQYEEFITLDTELTKELRNEGYINDFIRQYQNARKRGKDINYGDPVKLTVGIEISSIQEVLENYLKEHSEDLSISELEFENDIEGKTFKLGDTEISIEVERL
jgi:isoleucyl-tRNA synthetase